MNRKKKTFSIAFVTILAVGAIIMYSCSKENSSNENISNVINQEKTLLEEFQKPNDGFLCKIVNEEKGTTEILIGTTLDEKIETNVFYGSEFAYQADVLYTFEEDLESIIIENQTNESFDMTVFGLTYHLSDFKDIPGGIIFSLRNPGGNIITETIYHDSICVDSILINIAKVDTLENPFTTTNNTKGVIKDIGKFLKTTAGKIIAAASVIGIVCEMVDSYCERNLEIAKYNCSQTDKKCIKRTGICEFSCISCDQLSNS